MSRLKEPLQRGHDRPRRRAFVRHPAGNAGKAPIKDQSLLQKFNFHRPTRNICVRNG